MELVQHFCFCPSETETAWKDTPAPQRGGVKPKPRCVFCISGGEEAGGPAAAQAGPLEDTWTEAR